MSLISSNGNFEAIGGLFDQCSSESASKEKAPQGFVARFRGFTNEGSDKVPGALLRGDLPKEEEKDLPITTAREPGTLTLAGSPLAVC